MIAQTQNIIFSTSLTKVMALLCCLVIAGTQKALAYTTEAEFAILQDYTTGTVLYEKKADERLVPSSMTKLMTLYLVFKELQEGKTKLTDMINISEQAWRTGGSKMFVPLGQQVPLEDLIYGIAVQSGNDACVAIAEGLGGNEAAFAEQMNHIAAQIGMTGSHFTNSSGLPDDNHYSTAHDLALLASRLLQDFPQQYHYFTAPEYTYNAIKQQNRNLLLGIGGVDGLKTGHTEAGGYGIVISAQRNGQRLIGVINGLRNESARKREAENLLNYGFGNFTYKQLYKAKEVITTLPIMYGTSSQVPLAAQQDVAVVLSKIDNKFSTKIRYSSPIFAPIKAGEKLAELVIKHNDQEITVPLVAAQDVPETTFLGRIWQNIKYYAS